MSKGEPTEVERAIAEAHRREWAAVLAATLYTVRDLDLAEECVQEAYASALVAWDRDGVPSNPAAWLTTTAKRRAVDVIRREVTLRSKLPLLVDVAASVEHEIEGGAVDLELVDDVVTDERLRLIFMCCHPSLAPEAQTALTLRLVCGMPTIDIAQVFLVPETTMAARLTRAKRKITTARIPLRVPTASELPDRLRGVLGVIYLLFTMGHTASSGPSATRPELVDQSLHLTFVLKELMPDEREVRGLLALLLVTDARRATRITASGELVRLEDQDRSQWDRQAIARAADLLAEGPRAGQAGRYVLQAQIALVHAQASRYGDTDWPRILRGYDELLTVWPTPVVALNRAVAVSMVKGPGVALADLELLEATGELAGYHYLPAVKADFLERLGRTDEAMSERRRAMELTRNESERAFLAARLADSPLAER